MAIENTTENTTSVQPEVTKKRYLKIGNGELELTDELLSNYEKVMQAWKEQNLSRIGNSKEFDNRQKQIRTTLGQGLGMTLNGATPYANRWGRVQKGGAAGWADHITQQFFMRAAQELGIDVSSPKKDTDETSASTPTSTTTQTTGKVTPESIDYIKLKLEEILPNTYMNVLVGGTQYGADSKRKDIINAIKYANEQTGNKVDISNIDSLTNQELHDLAVRLGYTLAGNWFNGMLQEAEEEEKKGDTDYYSFQESLMPTGWTREGQYANAIFAKNGSGLHMVFDLHNRTPDGKYATLSSFDILKDILGKVDDDNDRFIYVEEGTPRYSKVNIPEDLMPHQLREALAVRTPIGEFSGDNAKNLFEYNNDGTAYSDILESIKKIANLGTLKYADLTPYFNGVTDGDSIIYLNGLTDLDRKGNYNKTKVGYVDENGLVKIAELNTNPDGTVSISVDGTPLTNEENQVVLTPTNVRNSSSGKFKSRIDSETYNRTTLDAGNLNKSVYTNIKIQKLFKKLRDNFKMLGTIKNSNGLLDAAKELAQQEGNADLKTLIGFAKNINPNQKDSALFIYLIMQLIGVDQLSSKLNFSKKELYNIAGGLLEVIYNNQAWKPQSLKNGGVIKASNGIKFEDAGADKRAAALRELKLLEQVAQQTYKTDHVARIGSGAFGEDNEWKGQDIMRAGAAALDAASLISTAFPPIAVATSIGAMILDFAADATDKDVTKGEMFANLGMNIGFTALACVGGGGVKVASKAAKNLRKANQVLNHSQKIVTQAVKKGAAPDSAVKLAKQVIKEGKNTLRAIGKNEDIVLKAANEASLGQFLVNVADNAARYVNYGFVLAGGVTGYNSVKNIYQDISEGKGVSLNDARGLIALTGALKGARAIARQHMVKSVTVPLSEYADVEGAAAAVGTAKRNLQLKGFSKDLADIKDADGKAIFTKDGRLAGGYELAEGETDSDAVVRVINDKITALRGKLDSASESEKSVINSAITKLESKFSNPDEVKFSIKSKHKANASENKSKFVDWFTGLAKDKSEARVLKNANDINDGIDVYAGEGYNDLGWFDRRRVNLARDWGAIEGVEVNKYTSGLDDIAEFGIRDKSGNIKDIRTLEEYEKPNVKNKTIDFVPDADNTPLPTDMFKGLSLRVYRLYSTYKLDGVSNEDALKAALKATNNKEERKQIVRLIKEVRHLMAVSPKPADTKTNIFNDLRKLWKPIQSWGDINPEAYYSSRYAVSEKNGGVLDNIAVRSYQNEGKVYRTAGNAKFKKDKNEKEFFDSFITALIAQVKQIDGGAVTGKDGKVYTINDVIDLIKDFIALRDEALSQAKYTRGGNSAYIMDKVKEYQHKFNNLGFHTKDFWSYFDPANPNEKADWEPEEGKDFVGDERYGDITDSRRPNYFTPEEVTDLNKIFEKVGKKLELITPGEDPDNNGRNFYKVVNIVKPEEEEKPEGDKPPKRDGTVATLELEDPTAGLDTVERMKGPDRKHNTFWVEEGMPTLISTGLQSRASANELYKLADVYANTKLPYVHNYKKLETGFDAQQDYLNAGNQYLSAADDLASLTSDADKSMLISLEGAVKNREIADKANAVKHDLFTKSVAKQEMINELDKAANLEILKTNQSRELGAQDMRSATILQKLAADTANMKAMNDAYLDSLKEGERVDLDKLNLEYLTDCKYEASKLQRAAYTKYREAITNIPGLKEYQAQEKIYKDSGLSGDKLEKAMSIWLSTDGAQVKKLLDDKDKYLENAYTEYQNQLEEILAELATKLARSPYTNRGEYGNFVPGFSSSFGTSNTTPKTTPYQLTVTLHKKGGTLSAQDKVDLEHMKQSFQTLRKHADILEKRAKREQKKVEDILDGLAYRFNQGTKRFK